MTEQNGLERSSATDTIRAMLDERGVEHMDFNMPESSLTLFAGDEHDGAYVENSVDTILTVYGASPAQAVEATLGSGESAKLRALVHDMSECIEHSSRNCDGCSLDKCNLYEFNRRMRELGVEV